MGKGITYSAFIYFKIYIFQILKITYYFIRKLNFKQSFFLIKLFLNDFLTVHNTVLESSTITQHILKNMYKHERIYS